MKYKIPFARTNTSTNEYDYVKDVLDSGWLTTGKVAKKFEENFKSYVNSKHAISVNSCTSALHLALEAIGIKENDKVIVPALTFTASAEVIRYFKAIPIIVDIDYDTCLITPEIVESTLKKFSDVKAIIIVHFGGQAAQLLDNNNNKGLLNICQKHKIPIIEDAAHAFPTKHNDKFIGTFGDITCFSFYANKTITTGEGGMITTDSDEYATRMRLMRLHGIDRDPWNNYSSPKPKWDYDVVAPGFKYNLPDINAAIGVAQLERAEDMRMKRQKCAQLYNEHFSQITSIDLPVLTTPMKHHSWHLYPIIINNTSQISRDDVVKLLFENGISTSVHYKPLYRMKYYKETYNLINDNYPGCEKYYKGCISLPIYPSLSKDEIFHIIKVIKGICA